MHKPFDQFRHDGFIVPHHTRRAIRAYVDHHKLPGRFLQAVISNDLRSAIFGADDTNRENLIAIVSYFHNETPAGCWGSVEALRAWVARGEREEEDDG